MKKIVNLKDIIKLFSEIIKNKELLVKGFKEIKNIINLNIMKCYYILFNIDGIKNNIGCYIISSSILIHFISIILFYKIDNFKLKKTILDIAACKKNNINEIENNRIIKRKTISINKMKKKKEKILKSAPIKKEKRIKMAKRITINILQTNSIIQNNNNENSKNIINLNKNEKINKNSVLKYNIYELNNLNYKEALKIDKRSYIKYYFSLLMTKHILLFLFGPLNDYNSRIIKILLFLFSFNVYIVVNALFFNDSTMHKIYLDKGSFNLIYQLPQIIYSSLISSLLIITLKQFGLSESNILQFKNNNKSRNKRSKNLIKFLFYKFILFFIINFILLLFFWYYISIFCAIYENTQIHLIKDTLISFEISLVYPIGIYLIPGIFRILSLKTNKREKMYKFSKIIQMI